MTAAPRRILTTHAGSLPRPDDVVALNAEVVRRLTHGQTIDDQQRTDRLRSAVVEVVQKQRELGIDIVNDGEFGKATVGSRLWCPISYRGQALLERDIAGLREAVRATGAPQAFMTAVAPGSFARGMNRYFRTREEFIFAVAAAMRTEYQAIVSAGFILQIDDPGFAESWDAMDPSVTLDDYRAYIATSVEALNHALEGLPEDRIRYHLCWGSWHGPHVTDLPLREVADQLLRVRAGGLLG